VNLIRAFAEHRLAANLTMIVMTLLGLWTVRVMPTQLDPPSQFPLVFVEVTWRGASAEDVEALLANPVEQQLRTLPNLKELTSRSEEGYLRVHAVFDYGTDISDALDQVKQRVGSIRNLPEDAEPPLIHRLLDQEAVASVIITGSGDVQELIPLVRSFERDLYARGIDQIEFDGLPSLEIALQVSSRQLQQLDLSLNDLARQIGAVSANVPAGTVGLGQGAHTLRGLEQARDTEAFSTLPVETRNGLTPLGMFAEIHKRPERGRPEVTNGGNPAIEMILLRRTDADAALADRIVERWLADVQPTLPAGVTVEKSVDVWRLLGAQLDMVWNNAVSGLVLVVLVLWIFLNTRVAAWVAAGIPVSILFGLTAFHYVFGFDISIVALIGLIMAIGIVVDDSIVVSEEVVSRHEAGASPVEAAGIGSQNMWSPVLSSSLTTLAAFLPMLIMGGEMGDVVLALPTILLCVITASLIECFLVLPGHLRGSLGKPSRLDNVRWRLRVNQAFLRFRDGPVMSTTRFSLHNPGLTLLVSSSSLVLAFVLISSRHVPFNNVMGFDFEALEANVQFASMASDADRREFIRHLEFTLGETHRQAGSSNIEGFITRYNVARFANDRLFGEQYASLTATYAFEEHRTTSPDAFIEEWHARIKQPPYVEQLILDVSGGKNGGQPDLTLVLRGQDLGAVKAGANELKTAMAAYPGVTNIVDDLPFGKEQIVFELTPSARALGLTTAELGSQLRAAYSGALVQIYNQNQSEVEVRVVLPEDEQDDLAKLQQFPVKTPAGTLVPLGNLAVLHNRRGIDIIRHTDAQMAVRIYADVDSERMSTMALLEELQSKVLPPLLEKHHLYFGLAGKSEQDQLIFDTLMLGGALTMVLIYIILAWTFSSWLWPLAIMITIPFGFAGAVFGHWITGWEIGAMSMLGFLALSGIVVNDAIVLISVFKECRERGVAVIASLETAVQSRFRAVFLTSATTVAGLGPLMFEQSSLAFMVAPIAVTLSFGLTFATALVLFVIPAVLVLLEGAREKITLARSRHQLSISHGPAEGGLA
jgi:multidrug efflux pump subunit AcrB